MKLSEKSIRSHCHYIFSEVHCRHLDENLECKFGRHCDQKVLIEIHKELRKLLLDMGNTIVCKKCGRECENEPLRKGLCVDCFIKKNVKELHRYIDEKIGKKKNAKKVPHRSSL